MRLIAIKTEDGRIKGKLSFYCRMLKVSTRQGFYKYLLNKPIPWKYQSLDDIVREIAARDECNDTYGRRRMYQAVLLKQPGCTYLPSERTVYRIMENIGLGHCQKHKPNGITEADREAHKSDNLLKMDFTSEEPLKKCVTDITEIKAKGKNSMFQPYLTILTLQFSDFYWIQILRQHFASKLLPTPFGYIRLSQGQLSTRTGDPQYTSEIYRKTVAKYGILQSMNSDGGRCHDNARCENM